VSLFRVRVEELGRDKVTGRIDAMDPEPVRRRRSLRDSKRRDIH
jgi:hypothetical protein